MYLTVFTILFLLVIIENYNLVPLEKRSVFNLFVGLIFVLHDGLRWEMGTDFLAYFDHFNMVNMNPCDYDNFEILYVKLVEFSKFLIDSYTFFLLLHATIIYALIITAVRKYSNYSFLALSFYYVAMIGLLGSNRQLIALALCFFSIGFIVEKRWLFFFGLMLLAFGFHKTSIVFLLVLFLDRKINFNYLIGSLFVCSLLSMSGYMMGFFKIVTLELLPSLFENKAEFYLYSNDEFGNSTVGTLFGLIRKALPIVLLIFIENKGFENKHYNVIFNLSVLALLTYILFNNNLQFLVGRLTFYFSIFECVIYSWFFIVLYRSKIKFALILLFAIFCIVIFFRSIAIYPEIFIPYKSVISK